MLFGPMKPVGLEDPRTGKRPYAVVQLRQDDAAGTLYNIVGFQTHLKWGAQKEVIQADSRARKCGNCSLWSHAPQHVYEFPTGFKCNLSISKS